MLEADFALNGPLKKEPSISALKLLEEDDALSPSSQPDSKKEKLAASTTTTTTPKKKKSAEKLAPASPASGNITHLFFFF